MTNRLIAPMLLILAALLTAVPAMSAEVDPERMRNLEKELRCLVCQNQSIADSHADLAADLRKELERLMLEGKTDDEIRAWMVERYGDFVLYRPPFKPMTWALWLGPFVLLGLGAIIIYRVTTTSRKSDSEAAAVDPEKLKAALGRGKDA